MRYWIHSDGQNQGPYPEEELAGMLCEGRIHPYSLAAAEGSQEWVPLSALMEMPPGMAPPPPPGLASPSAATPVSSSSSSAIWIVVVILILVVIAIVGIAVIFVVKSASTAPSDGATEAKIQRIRAALISYRLRGGTFPAEEQGLRALVEAPTSEPVPRNWEKLFDELPRDGWKQEFVYEYSPGMANPVVISVGPDGVRGTSDDIRSDSP